MTFQIKPIVVQSLKDACITRLEALILSGKLKIGERLPPERSLAEQLNVSRPVVHEALVEIAAKGLVEIAPRKGIFVNDFRAFGSCALLESLLTFQNGQLDAHIQGSMIDFRLLIERETARLAARNSNGEQRSSLSTILAQEQNTPADDIKQLIELDFAFHHGVAMASANMVYPLIINSFKNVYTHLTSKFFRYNPTETIHEVFDFHAQLLEAIDNRDEKTSEEVMTAMLLHGARHLHDDPQMSQIDTEKRFVSKNP